MLSYFKSLSLHEDIWNTQFWFGKWNCRLWCLIMLHLKYTVQSKVIIVLPFCNTFFFFSSFFISWLNSLVFSFYFVVILLTINSYAWRYGMCVENLNVSFFKVIFSSYDYFFLIIHIYTLKYTSEGTKEV